jgi:hypothetical protein
MAAILSRKLALLRGEGNAADGADLGTTSASNVIWPDRTVTGQPRNLLTRRVPVASALPHRIARFPGHCRDRQVWRNVFSSRSSVLTPGLEPSFYAVKLVIGDLGTFDGIRTKPGGCVLRRDGSMIDGLDAVGNVCGRQRPSEHHGRQLSRCRRHPRPQHDPRLHHRQLNRRLG